MKTVSSYGQSDDDNDTLINIHASIERRVNQLSFVRRVQIFNYHTTLRVLMTISLCLDFGKLRCELFAVFRINVKEIAAPMCYVDIISKHIGFQFSKI